MSEIPVLLLAFFVLASYVQTMTGFAFGLVVMSAAAVFSLVPLDVAAFVVSVLSLLNGAIGLSDGMWRQVNTKVLWVFFFGSVPVTGLGVYLLGYLGANALDWLQLLLGLTIIFACGMSLIKPKKIVSPSKPVTFFLCGGFAGLLGGLFSTAGPPISYLMYRQPVTLNVIKSTLLCIFVISCLVRISMMVVSGQVTTEMVWLSVMGVPCVFITTVLAKRYPPNISPETIKCAAMVLLLLSGVSLSLKALF